MSGFYPDGGPFPIKAPIVHAGRWAVDDWVSLCGRASSHVTREPDMVTCKLCLRKVGRPLIEILGSEPTPEDAT